jgi:hypothetical protein
MRPSQQHIVRHYSSTDSPLATHTIFLQPHIPWPGTAFPRLESMTANTGFMSLSTYVNASCPADGSEIDVLDQVHPRIAQIYSSFQQDLCPSTGFTVGNRKGRLRTSVCLLMYPLPSVIDHVVWAIRGFETAYPSKSAESVPKLAGLL